MNKKYKIATILGARPQFIKASPISALIHKKKIFHEVIIHTGQHFDENMSDVFFKQMNIPKPAHNLNINQMDYGNMIDSMFQKIIKIIKKERIDGVLVFGDTNSTLAGSLSATHLQIPIFHVEAGLRSYNKEMPEENNRVITDHLSSLLFCPTESAKNNLSNEGIISNVLISGDVMYDAYLRFSFNKNKIQSFIPPYKYLLATLHRRENLNSKSKLKMIFNNLDKINEKIKIIMPLHPHTKKMIKDYSIKTKIIFIEPVGYLSMISLLNNSEMVITDSGGLQKESYFAKKKAIVVRTETEWKELVRAGVNELSSPIKLYDTFEKISQKNVKFSKKYYGEGNASKIIVDNIRNFFK